MTLALRITLIAASVATTWLIVRKIRGSKLRIEDSLFWIGFSGLLILFSVFPRIPTLLARIAGTYTTANFIYIVIIFLLIVKLFFLTLKISLLESKVSGLVQEMALEENRRNKNNDWVREEFKEEFRKELQEKSQMKHGKENSDKTGIVNP